MSANMGLWIDHRKAVVVALTDIGEEIELVSLEVERYYDDVIARICMADSLLIFGPGEAKHELNKRLEAQQLGDRIVAMETVDKLTEGQIAAKVRHYFFA